MLRFASPLWLLLLAAPLWSIVSMILRRRKREGAILFSDVTVFRRIGTGMGPFKHWTGVALSHAAIVLLIIAMARPQTGTSFNTRTARGIDIILAMDISSSMEAMDFQPLTRFEASREVVKDFISKRSNDRIGLVVFSAQSFTLCPLTLDYEMLAEFLDRAWDSRIEDGTAIGSAIATSCNRLRDSNAKSKIIILLTDGMNNRGAIDPLTAAQVATTLGIKVYTIGVGSEGRAPFNVQGRVRWLDTHIDEDTLKEVARLTNGAYYRAKNKDDLMGIYREIDTLETTEIEYKEWVEYDEKYAGFLRAGLLVLVLSFLLDRTILRRLP